MSKADISLATEEDVMEQPVPMPEEVVQEAEAMAVNPNPNAPPMQILGRIMQLPLVESAVKKSQDVYGKIKTIPVMGSTLNVAEGMTRRITTPLVHKLGTPLGLIDHTLVLSLDKLENTVPLVRETPSEIIRRTERAVTSLKELSLRKTNDVLATRGGVRALNTLDAASVRAMNLVDHFLPAHETEMEMAIAEEAHMPADGVSRAVHAVGKVGRTVTGRLHGKAQRALPTAICSLGLAGTLESLNGKVQEMRIQDDRRNQ